MQIAADFYILVIKEKIACQSLIIDYLQRCVWAYGCFPSTNGLINEPNICNTSVETYSKSVCKRMDHLLLLPSFCRHVFMCK